MLGNLHASLSSADFFPKSSFSKISFRNTIRVTNSLDPDQARHFVGPDLGPNCLQRLSADDSTRQRVKEGVVFRTVNWAATEILQKVDTQKLPKCAATKFKCLEHSILTPSSVSIFLRFFTFCGSNFSTDF